jgi:hypothetical protein
MPAAAVALAAASPVDAEPSFTVLPQVTGETGANTPEGISADGSTVTGMTFGPTQAFRWTAATGTVPLFPVMQFISTGLDASADGSVVVGTLTTSDFGQPPFMNEGFRWTQAGGLEHLGSLPGGTTESAAPAISDDGTIIVGSSSSDLGLELYRWTAAEGMVGLGIQPGMTSSSGLGISGDGTTIVGGSQSGGGGGAFYWTDAPGFVGIGTLVAPDPGSAFATDASADGSVNHLLRGLHPPGACRSRRSPLLPASIPSIDPVPSARRRNWTHTRAPRLRARQEQCGDATSDRLVSVGGQLGGQMGRCGLGRQKAPVPNWRPGLHLFWSARRGSNPRPSAWECD